MSTQKKTKSRRPTPWDGKTEVTPTQEYIRERHKGHYHNHHKPLKDDDEAKLINQRILSECRVCRSTDFKKYGFNGNGVQVYKCRSCGHKFTILTNTIFDSHKIPISEWIEFLYNLFSFVRLNAGSWNNKNAFTTSRYWLDETFYPLRSSDLVIVDGKKLRGLSRNQICIGVARDSERVFCVLEGTGKPSQKKTFDAFKDHIARNSTLVHDKEQAHRKLVAALNLTSETYAADQIKRMKDADNPLQRVNRIHFFLKRFLSAHTGFKREEIEGFINLFSFL